MSAGAPEPLTGAEAAARLRQYGPNLLPQGERRRLVGSILQILREPMFLLLLASGVVYLFLGEVRDALVLMAFATGSTVIALVQERRSERVLESLRTLGAPRAWVLRREGRSHLPAAEIVPGDIMILDQGDRIAADGVLVQTEQIETDESLLTGESAPVVKSAARSAERTDEAAQVFAGSMIVRGHGLAQVTATGTATRMGELGVALKSIKPQPSRLIRQSRKLVAVLGCAALAVCLGIVLGFGLGRGAWLTGVLGGLAVGMALIPEEVPLVMTVYSVMGAFRIAKAGVLARTSSAIEALGSATVLCTDKTGTLTLNRMTVAGGAIGGEEIPTGDARLVGLARLAALASDSATVEPMERAFHDCAGAVQEPGPRLAWFGFSPQFLATARVWRAGTLPDGLQATAKGAPETIAALCRLSEAERESLLRTAALMGQRGARVLGVASADWTGPSAPKAPQDIPFKLAGLMGLADPLRPEAPGAIGRCIAAGIRVIMVTGDHPATARAIAAQAGLPVDLVLSGADMEGMTDAALADAARNASVFARITPIQKLRLVRALQASGQVVAMTGDGVNDAPALKAADIGVAMGARGTDVAREAAALILIKDGLGAIADAVALGRRIFGNLSQALVFILAVHIPIAVLAIVPPLLGGELVLVPLHIALLELFIDPVCSIAFEAERGRKDLMTMPPRASDAPLLSRGQALAAVLLGCVGAAIVMAAFFVSRALGDPSSSSRAAAFIALVMVDVAFVFATRVLFGGAGALARPNQWMLALAGGALALIAVGMGTPFGRGLLQVTPPAAPALALIAALTPALFLTAWLARGLTGIKARPAV